METFIHPKYYQIAGWRLFGDAMYEAKPTPASPLVMRDPLERAPLSVLLAFNTDEDEAFDVTLCDSQDRVYLSFKSEPSSYHAFVLPTTVGGAKVHGEGTRGSIFDEAFEAINIEGLPTIDFKGQLSENQLLLMAAADGEGPAWGINCYGEVSWLCDYSLSHTIKPMDNGHFYCGGFDQLAPPNSGVAIWEMDLLGWLHRDYRFEDGFVGDFAVLEDELVAITQAAWQGTLRDTLLWIDKESGETTRRLDLKSVLPPIGGSGGQSGSDWFQGASLRYHKESGLLYLSGLAQNIVMVVDAQTAEVVDIIGDVALLGESVQKKSKHPLAKGVFEEAYGVTRRDDALYYVNAHRYPNGERTASLPFDVQKLDLETGTADTFICNQDALVSPFLCDLSFYDDKVLILAGGMSNSNSIVPGVLALKKQDDLKLAAQVMLYKGRDKIAQLWVGTNLASAALITAKGVDDYMKDNDVLGQWTPSFEVDIDLPVASEGRLEDEMNIEFWCDDERLYLSGDFFKGEACVLILSKGEEKHQFFLTTNRKPFGAEWIYTYAGGIERKLNWAIPMEPLSVGEWTIDILIDDMLLHSKETVVREDWTMKW